MRSCQGSRLLELGWRWCWRKKNCRLPSWEAALRLQADLLGLSEVMSSLTPPRRLVCSWFLLQVFYGFRYASTMGHIANFQGFKRNGEFVVADGWIDFCYGHWCDAISKASSKYRVLDIEPSRILGSTGQRWKNQECGRSVSVHRVNLT
jgi:hypothetical protein